MLIIDAGHGGIDPRTGQYTTPAKMHRHLDGGEYHGDGWFYEGVSNRAIAARLERMMRDAGEPYLRVYDDVDDWPLRHRVAMTNQLAALQPCCFISLHSNAGGGKGWEVFVSRNASEVSRAFAEALYQSTRELFGDEIRYRTSGGGKVYKEAGFAVLKRTQCPAVLVENLFFDDAIEARMLLQSDVQERFAFAAFSAYLSVKPLLLGRKIV